MIENQTLMKDETEKPLQQILSARSEDIAAQFNAKNEGFQVWTRKSELEISSMKSPSINHRNMRTT
jgi:hypothetical protein